MEPYTAFSGEAQEAIEDAVRNRGGRYPMNLNQADFSTILYSLWDTAQNSDNEELAEAAASLWIDIAASLDVVVV